MNNLKELIKQIEKVEGVKLSISVPFNENKKLFDDYPYTTPISGNKTVDDLLNERVYPILNKIENKLDEIILDIKNKEICLKSNILVGANNLDQILSWFVEKYKKLNKAGKTELACRYENTYVIKIIEQIDIDLENSKKVKKVRKTHITNPTI